MSPFAKALHDYRIRVGLTLRNFCKTVECDASYWSMLERGYAPAPEEEYFYLKIKALLRLTDEEYQNLLILKKDHQWQEEPPFF